jgi:pyridoxamine 5'-phosphate oxidase
MGCGAREAKPNAWRTMTDPFALFDDWFAEARAGEPNEPEAMTVATAGDDRQPSARMVLLKAHGPEGFVFYTHEASAKGQDLAENPQAGLLFHWKSLCRQVRIEGSIEPVTDAEADAYFASRSRDSQLGAWASDQSRPLDRRETFERRFEEVKRRFEGSDVPRPSGWIGYRVVPERIEFWTAREHRLHERRLFVRGDGGWSEGLLYP